MKISARVWTWMLLLMAVTSLLLFGCSSSTPSINGSGVGADGGQWPKAQPGVSTTAANQNPKAQLTVLLRSTTPKDTAITLNVTSVKLKYEKEHWLSIATAESIAKTQAMPIRFDRTSAGALLLHGPIARHTYTHMQLAYVREKSFYTQGDTALPLAAGTVTLGLGAWTPDDKLPNMLIINLDGNQVTVVKGNVSINSPAFSVKSGKPTGGITGAITAGLPTAKVEAVWEGTTYPLGHAAPMADGTFVISSLPPGNYQLRITADGYQLSEPLKNPISVSDKVIMLEKALTLRKVDPTTTVPTTAAQ